MKSDMKKDQDAMRMQGSENGSLQREDESKQANVLTQKNVNSEHLERGRFIPFADALKKLG